MAQQIGESHIQMGETKTETRLQQARRHGTLAAEQQLVQARRALLSSQVALYAALGGGSAGRVPAATDSPSDSNSAR